jgi:hypothetical protein
MQTGAQLMGIAPPTVPIPPTIYSATADQSGVTDIVSILQALAVSDVQIAAGNYYINATIVVPANRNLILSPGAIINAVVGGSWINNMMAVIQNVNNSQIIGGIWNGLGSTNVAAIGGIGIYGALHTRVDHITTTNLSYWSVESLGSSTVANLDFELGTVISRNCAAGVHYQGVSGSSYHSEGFGTDIQVQQCGAATGSGANMDALFIEDSEDILISSVNTGMVAGTGYDLHLKGNVATCHITNADIGGGANAVCRVENNLSAVGPQDIWIEGTLQQSSAGYGLWVTGVANELHFKCRFFDNFLSGVNLAGSGSAIDLDGSIFNGNNQAGTTNYDITSTQTVIFSADNCKFLTPIGITTVGNVPQSVNDTTHQGLFTNCKFLGSGSGVTTAFSAAGSPQIVRNSIGINPRGQVTSPTITTGTFSTNTSQYDTSVIFTAINGMTSFSINGIVITILRAVGVPYRIAARSPLIVISATTAPTWQWYAE